MVEDEADDPIDDDKGDNDEGVDHLGNKLNNLKKKGKCFKHFTSNLFIVSDINPKSLKKLYLKLLFFRKSSFFIVALQSFGLQNFKLSLSEDLNRKTLPEAQRTQGIESKT